MDGRPRDGGDRVRAGAMVLRSIRKAGNPRRARRRLHAHVQGGEVDLTDALAAFADQVDQQREEQTGGDHPEGHRHPPGHPVGGHAVSAEARIAAPAVSEIARRRPARRIVVSSDAARKFTSSFCPGGRRSGVRSPRPPSRSGPCAGPGRRASSGRAWLPSRARGCASGTCPRRRTGRSGSSVAAASCICARAFAGQRERRREGHVVPERDLGHLLQDRPSWISLSETPRFLAMSARLLLERLDVQVRRLIAP